MMMMMMMMMIARREKKRSKKIDRFELNHPLRRTIQGILHCRYRVYASYHRFENLEVIVHDLNYRSRAIRSAGRSGHNPVFLGIVARMIDSENEHRCIDRW